MIKKIVIGTVVTLIVLLVVCLSEQMSYAPEEKSLEDVKMEIDSYFLDTRGTTYYYNWWFLSKSKVGDAKQLLETLLFTPEQREKLEAMGIATEISEEEWIDFWVGSTREGTNWLHLYETGVFDCSEMSALAECQFEQMGFETSIAFNSEHAWVVIKTDKGYVPVETTGSFVVIPETETISGKTYADYLNWDGLFATIYEAEKYCPGDYDWWKSATRNEVEMNDARWRSFLDEWLTELRLKKLAEAGLL
jgi:hypothetical protein